MSGILCTIGNRSAWFTVSVLLSLLFGGCSLIQRETAAIRPENRDQVKKMEIKLSEERKKALQLKMVRGCREELVQTFVKVAGEQLQLPGCPDALKENSILFTDNELNIYTAKQKSLLEELLATDCRTVFQTEESYLTQSQITTFLNSQNENITAEQAKGVSEIHASLRFIYDIYFPLSNHVSEQGYWLLTNRQISEIDGFIRGSCKVDLNQVVYWNEVADSLRNFVKFVTDSQQRKKLLRLSLLLEEEIQQNVPKDLFR